MTMNKVTEDEHIVSVFVLKKFCGTNCKMGVYDKEEDRHFTAPPKRVFFKKNMYETLNADGTFYSPNVIENRFASIETEASKCIRSIEEHMKSGREITEFCHVMSMLFTAVQLIRGLHIKEMIFSKELKTYMTADENRLYNEAMYRMLIHSSEDGLAFLRENGLGFSPEVEDMLKGNTFLDTAINFMVNECAVYYIKTDDEHPFIISDNPVIVDYNEKVKYVFPVAPNIAICCRLFENAKEEHYGGILEVNEKDVKQINRRIYDQAIRFVGYQPHRIKWLECCSKGEE